jgi:two-component system phosphate regulon sensor histidine kinase PhoR
MVDSYLKVIADENKRLGMVVENVLRTAIIDKGELKLRQEDIDLHALIATVARNMEIQANGKGGAIETDLAATTCHVQGDSVHLTNVVFNLIDNALKYTRDTPLVRISTFDGEPGHIRIAVEDNGIGMAKDQLQRIFDQFYRVPTGNVHDVKGFGLGLSYVKAIVEKHGGRVQVMSEPGRGSRFELTLPLMNQKDQLTHGNFE